MPFLASQLNALPLAAALVALVWLALKAARGLNAATRHVLWWLVLAVAVVLPLVPRSGTIAPRPDSAPRAATAAGAPFVATLPVPPEPTWRRYEEAAAALAFLVSAVFVLRLAASLAGVWWMKRRASFSRRQDIRFRRVRILESGTVASPVACGYLRPAVLLPARWDIGEESLRPVLLHELAHLARFDDLGLLLQRLVQAVFWWNPLVWFITRQLDLEREIACDDWAVAHSGGGVRPYAATLARLVEMRLAPEASLLAPGAVGRPSQFAQRIERLLQAGRDAAPRVARLRLAGAVALLGALVAAAVSLPALFAFEYEAAPRPAARASFLAGLVQAGYGSLSVDEIIQLKDNGVDGPFLQRATAALGVKPSVADLIQLRHHQADFDLARALRQAAIEFDTPALIEASQHGVRAHHVREALQYKNKLAVREIIRLKESGVI